MALASTQQHAYREAQVFATRAAEQLAAVRAAVASQEPAETAPAASVRRRARFRDRSARCVEMFTLASLN